MTEQELSTERLIFAALLKAASEQACYLTGTLKFKMKQDFNVLVKQMDHFVNDVEARLKDQPAGLEYFEQITDYYHNFNIELRNNLNKKYQEVSNSEKEIEVTHERSI